MIRAVIRICQAHSRFDLGFLLQQYAGAVTFRQFLKHLAIKIEVEKFRLAQKNIFLAQMQQELALLKAKSRTRPQNQLTRTNTNLKNFDQAHSRSQKEPFHHRRNRTAVEADREPESIKPPLLK